MIQDFVPGASGPDISYHEPSNKDDQAIGPDRRDLGLCVGPNPTDKTDIVNAYGMAVQGDGPVTGDGDGDTADDQLFYFGVERFDNSGDAFIGLWLFQDDVSCTADGKFVGSKQTGDILILANFTGGGSTATIQLFRYTAGIGSNPGTFGELAAVTGKCENTPSGDQIYPFNDICATSTTRNASTRRGRWKTRSSRAHPTPTWPSTLEPDQFVEGGVNLTDIFLATQGTPPPCFGSFLAETRSSSSLSATLKDYALGDLQFCDADISITPTETNRVGEQHTFTVEVDQKVGSGEVAATVGDVEYTLTGSNGITADDIVVDPASTCINGAGVEDDLDADGKCTIIFHSDVGGIDHRPCHRGRRCGRHDSQPRHRRRRHNSDDAVKTYVDATIDITGDGTNRVGAAHEFSVLVEADDGSGDGFHPVEGQEVTVHKADDLGAVSDPAGDQTCTTAADGTCSVEFSSDSTGTTTGTAEADVTVGGLEFTITTATDAAVEGNEEVLKTWVDASINISGDGTNRVDAPHVFTVTVLADDGDGTGPQPVESQVVDVTLTDTLGATSVIDDDPDTTSTCDDGTDAGGQCTVTFSSATTGVTTGTASANVTVGGISFDINTTDDATTEAKRDATKTWVDARIGITGDDTNSIEEDHTFTVLLEKDLGDGAGFVPAGSEDVDVTLTNDGAAFILDATGTTCDVGGAANTDADTDAAGECDVVFTSNIAGTVNGEATSTVSVGGVSITVSTDDTGSTGDAVKEFIDGSIRWLKHDGDGALLGGATFEVCRTARLDSSDGSYDPEDVDPDLAGDQPFCFTVFDDFDGTADAPDADETAGEIQVNDLVLGLYNVKETIPPVGYHIQVPPGAGPFDFPAMTIEPLNVDVELETIFVNIKAFRIIVITCDDITDLLVDGTVNLDPAGTFDSTKETISPTDFTALGWFDSDETPLTQTDFCNQGGASFGDLPDDTYNATIEVPDHDPVFPDLP